MSLTRYRGMRRFADTPEPSGGVGGGGDPIFVVQLHHASHRHYDFRLQVGGVLKSWAVPRGPSFDPNVRRLAVEVEDHPLDYAGFEGTIPTGNYGAGNVRIFDHGTWSTDGHVRGQLGKGHLRFSLLGDKLRGAWDLVRTGEQRGKPSWILRKVEDEEAGPFEADDLLGDPEEQPTLTAVWHSRPKGSPSPRARAAKQERSGSTSSKIEGRAFSPELALKVETPPSGAGWLHEPKWDGYRLLAVVADGLVRLWSRNAIEWTDRLPELARAVAGLGARALRLDGELIAGEGRRADFAALQAALAEEAHATLRYAVFDLLHVDGVDLSARPLADRKRMLTTLLERRPSPLLLDGPTWTGDGAKLLARAMKDGYEGLVSKRVDSPYVAGRSDAWRKCRPRDADELAVVGFTEPRGARVGIGALAIARPIVGGWSYAGRVGTGVSTAQLGALRKALTPLARDTPPVTEESLIEPRAAGYLRGVTWVEPELVVEVEHVGHGGHGLLRQPVIKALRPDKRARDLLPGSDRMVERKATPKVVATAVKLTHGERVVYPVGYTKAHVFAYYRAIAPYFLREGARRPLAVVRCPDGILGQRFFQKHVTPTLGPEVRGVNVALPGHKPEEHLYIDDATGLLELAQMNVIELHAWGCHVADVEHADRLVFDLDPADDVAWPRVMEGARRVRALLGSLGLESFVRVSGGKGLHVVAPLSPAAPWDRVKPFCKAVAAQLSAAYPGDFLDVMTKARRAGRIFVDYLRNGRGATAIASYSLRRTPEATVAMPITWKELARIKSAQTFTMPEALKHLTRAKADPWEGIDALAQPLPSSATGG